MRVREKAQDGVTGRCASSLFMESRMAKKGHVVVVGGGGARVRGPLRPWGCGQLSCAQRITVRHSSCCCCIRFAAMRRRGCFPGKGNTISSGYQERGLRSG